jgi:hypothetical protein
MLNNLIHNFLKNHPKVLNWYIHFRAKKVDKAVISFLESNQKQLHNSLILVFNPDDSIVGSYRGLMINTKMSKKEGGKKRLLKTLMTASQRDKVMDNFLLVVDGLVYSLSEKVREKRRSKKNKIN